MSLFKLMMLLLQGSHSTKIVGITRTLLNIQRGQPGTKSLVFSSVSPLHHHSHRLTVRDLMHYIAPLRPPQWLEVLDLIARALRENDVKFSLLKTKATFQVTREACQRFSPSTR